MYVETFFLSVVYCCECISVLVCVVFLCSFRVLILLLICSWAHWLVQEHFNLTYM